ncbi:MAG: alpha-mannosidase [Chloroflexi bacterium]|nr:alpha-mannosidase [Chloroflexota bacterium]
MFFAVEKITKQLQDIRAAIHREARDIPRWKFLHGECPGAERPEFDDGAWADFALMDYWGGYDVTAWFRARAAIPSEWQGQKLALRLRVGPPEGGESAAETMLYVNGHPLQGLDVWHEEAWLPPDLLPGEEISIALKAWNGVVGVPDRRRFQVAQLIWVDEATACFFYLADTILKTVKALGENDLRRLELLAALNDSFHRIQFLQPRSPEFYASVAEAEQALRQRVTQLERAEIKPAIVAVGHAHLDMAWLWRLKDTREKAARTFATALHLMRQYPEYRFTHSSPQLYQYLKDDHPDIYEKVKAKIAAGQWEITGGMWVEADTNLTSGESLVRQILFGKRWMRREFGVESRVVWLPDVFGYSAALPQIMRQSGLDFFMTTKISWSQFNRFPHDTFRWRGLDGSEVLTHFVTTPDPGGRYYTYNGRLTPSEVKGIWDVYQDRELNDELLLIYGWGDGGGGPTQEMLERARAMRNLPGLPRVELDTAENYFARLEKRLAEKSLPVWDGELYLEYHRGTYTSQARSKRANRQSEILFHDAEWLSALADVLTGQATYPQRELNRAWELILVNQFHDILPGSSIRQVYEDGQNDYAAIKQVGDMAIDAAARALVAQIAAPESGIVVFNSLSWERSDLIELPWAEELAAGQTIKNQGEKRVLLLAENVPALGHCVIARSALCDEAISNSQAKDCIALSGLAMTDGMTITANQLESRLYSIALDDRGQIVSLFDKTNQRDVLAPGARGNVLQAFEDKPMNFDAWDIDIYYPEKMTEVGELVDARVEEAGPLRGALRLQWRFHNSLITQRITLYRHSPRIDFRSEVDWHEHQVLLKVAFPVHVRATRATYDIQFGNVERPTHWNTSWDWARFEVVAHKWADLSEGNYGVALLNDCKYGYDCKNNVLRLTLLKSGIEPDANADQGPHAFTYSLLPHAGGWREANVAREAYALNYPLRALALPPNPHGALPARYGFAALDSDNVMVETVKKAEDGDAWIVRVYEYKQFRSRAVNLTFGQPIRRAVECNLLEEDDRPAAYQENRLTFGIDPYEIKTFKVWL